MTRSLRVSEDFPKRVTKTRTSLFPSLQKCHENKQEAYLRFDTLLVDGQPYVYDETRGRPVPVKRWLVEAHINFLTIQMKP